MLKGTTKIELTDVNTGETQVIEKHNAITGALQEIFNPVVGHLTDPTKLAATIPAYASLLGGLLLFDGRIEGDPLPLFAPENVKLVGCARHNVASTQGSKYAGSYDANESSFSEDTKTAKFVYNFTQAQANGTIGSVCLTHKTGGYGVYTSDMSAKATTKLATSVYTNPTMKITRGQDRFSYIRSFGNNEHLYAIDADNDLAYYFRATSATSLVMLKRRAGLKHYSIFGAADTIVGDLVTITLPTGIRAYASNENVNSYNFDTETNTLHIVSMLPNSSAWDIAPGAQFTVTSIKLGESIATQKTLTNNHTKNIYACATYVYRGKVYAATKVYTGPVNGKTAYKFDVIGISLTDNSVTSHGALTSSYAIDDAPKAMYAADGRLYWQTYYDSSTQGIGGLQVMDCVSAPADTNITFCGVDMLDNYSGNYYYPTSYTPVLNHPMICYISSCNVATNPPEYFAFLAHYLGTVNNLATPIVKAPTQTMKITYTIQEI